MLTILCRAGIHQWQQEPRTTTNEYATVIDHRCARCGNERFHPSGGYRHIADHARTLFNSINQRAKRREMQP